MIPAKVTSATSATSTTSATSAPSTTNASSNTTNSSTSTSTTTCASSTSSATSATIVLHCVMVLHIRCIMNMVKYMHMSIHVPVHCYCSIQQDMHIHEYHVMTRIWSHANHALFAIQTPSVFCDPTPTRIIIDRASILCSPRDQKRDIVSMLPSPACEADAEPTIRNVFGMSPRGSTDWIKWMSNHAIHSRLMNHCYLSASQINGVLDPHGYSRVVLIFRFWRFLK